MLLERSSSRDIKYAGTYDTPDHTSPTSTYLGSCTFIKNGVAQLPQCRITKQFTVLCPSRRALLGMTDQRVTKCSEGELSMPIIDDNDCNIGSCGRVGIDPILMLLVIKVLWQGCELLKPLHHPPCYLGWCSAARAASNSKRSSIWSYHSTSDQAG